MSKGAERAMDGTTDTWSAGEAGGSGGLFASAGAVAAGLLSAVCCAGPILFVTFGVGAGLASTFEPFRPVFTVLTFGLLAVGFWTVYGKQATARMASSMEVGEGKVDDAEVAGGGDAGDVAGEVGAELAGEIASDGFGDAATAVAGDAAVGPTCAVPRSRRKEKVVLWGATVAAVVFWSFPYWAALLV